MGLRVLVAYGSETGNSERTIRKIVKRWTAADSENKVSSFDIMSGSQVKALEEVRSSYDLILVATSSFGEGDPPDNFAAMLLKLLLGAQKGDKPLAGMQHAVLGFGASVYDTFQNTPRLADKYLEECGSRRLACRVEVDDASEDDPAEKLNQFETLVFQALQNLPDAASAAVCSWTKPEGKILEKTEEDLNGGFSQGSMGVSSGKIAAALAVIVAGIGAAYQMGLL